MIASRLKAFGDGGVGGENCASSEESNLASVKDRITFLETATDRPVLPVRPTVVRGQAAVKPTRLTGPPSLPQRDSPSNTSAAATTVIKPQPRRKPLPIPPKPALATVTATVVKTTQKGSKSPPALPKKVSPQLTAESKPTVVKSSSSLAKNQFIASQARLAAGANSSLPGKPTVVRSASRGNNSSLASNKVKNLRQELEGKLRLGGGGVAVAPTIPQHHRLDTEGASSPPGDLDNASVEHRPRPFSYFSNEAVPAPAHAFTDTSPADEPQSTYSVPQKSRPPTATVAPRQKTASPEKSASSHYKPVRKAPPPRPKDGPKVKTNSPEPQPYAIVAHNFEAEASDELNCKAGDRILLRRYVDAQWVFGTHQFTGAAGIIPVSFLDIKIPLSESGTSSPELRSPASPTSSAEDSSAIDSGPRCYTLFDFNSGMAGDLAFCQGERIRLLARCSAEWLEGEAQDGRCGIFPANFVEIIEDLPATNSGPETTAYASIQKQNDESMVVSALYDYSQPGEHDLSFRAGDRLELTGKFNQDWVYGHVMGIQDQMGLIPSNYVDRVPHNLPIMQELEEESNQNQLVQEEIATAIYDYDGQEASDLQFKAGDVIHVLQHLNADWLEGILDIGLTNKKSWPRGVFPKAFVQIDPATAQTDENANNVKVATALYDFDARETDELSFTTGTKICISGATNDEWWEGSIGQRFGRFPANFVQLD